MSTNAALMDTSIDDDNNADSLFSAPISDDWYHGHKVVAMPSSAFGGMSIREVVSSRNTETAANITSTSPRPRRSNSLGRGPIRPGRDIVQDVYDRMGVSYTRGMDYNSATEEETNYANAATMSSNDIVGNASRTGGSRLSEKFSGRYRTAAAMARSAPSTTNNSVNVNVASRGRNPEATTGTNSSPRGRTLEAEGGDFEESEGQRRARSLSRGRSVQGRWPPAQNHHQPSSEGIFEPKPTKESESSTAIPGSPKRTSPTMKRSHSFDGRPQYGGGLRSFHYKNHLRPTATAASNSIEMKDEKKECDDRSATSEPMGVNKDEDGASNRQSVPSIKDRISVFAGGNNSKSNTASNNNVKGYMKGAKPKINIYEDTNRVSDEQQQQPDDEEDECSLTKGQADETTATAPSAAAAAAAEEAYKYLRPSQMTASKNKLANRHSTGSNMNGRGSSVANSYLNGIQSPANSTNNRYSYNQAPIPEVVPSDENINNYTGSSNNFDSTSSVGASSCGDNDSIGNKMNRKPSSWRSYNSNNYLSPNNNNHNNNHARSTSSVASNHSNKNNQQSNNNNTVNVSAEVLERMVDERVQSQLREVEARMERLLRAWMDAMNNKITSRLDAMEASIKDSMPDPSWRHEI